MKGAVVLFLALEAMAWAAEDPGTVALCEALGAVDLRCPLVATPVPPSE